MQWADVTSTHKPGEVLRTTDLRVSQPGVRRNKEELPDGTAQVGDTSSETYISGLTQDLLSQKLHFNDSQETEIVLKLKKYC